MIWKVLISLVAIFFLAALFTDFEITVWIFWILLLTLLAYGAYRILKWMKDSITDEWKRTGYKIKRKDKLIWFILPSSVMLFFIAALFTDFEITVWIFWILLLTLLAYGAYRILKWMKDSMADEYARKTNRRRKQRRLK